MVVADTGNNRIQCFVRERNEWVVECVYPDYDQGAASWLLDGDQEGAKPRVSLSPGDPFALNAPRDVSVQVLSKSQVLIYVADTGNNRVRVLTFEIESLEEYSRAAKLARTVSLSSFHLLEDHHRRLFELDKDSMQMYTQVFPRTRLVCLATWGSFGSTPGYFNSPRAISSFLSVTRQHVEYVANRRVSENKHKLIVCVAIADSNRVQIIEHSVHVNTGHELNIKGKGCCLLQ